MLNNKVVWITGASSGIGEALAIAFAKEHAAIILSARRIEELERVQKLCLQYTPDVKIHQIDLAEKDTLKEKAEQAIALFGRVDFLINNGGISQRSAAEETPLEIDRKIMEVNYFGNIALSKFMLPHFKHKGSGKIIVLSSFSGKFGWKQRSAYSASKFALHGFYESLRAEISQYGISILIVCPGRIRTNISLNAITKDGSAHNKIDRGQAKGISAETCAQKIMRAIKRNKKEIFIAREERIVLFLRRIFPALYYSIAAKRDPNQ